MASDPDSADCLYVLQERSGGSAHASDKGRVMAGLQFSVSAVRRMMSRHKRPNQQVGRGGPVYLAAVLEYLSAEISELAGNIARKEQRKHITSDDVAEAILNDDELRKLFGFARDPSRQIKPTLIPATPIPALSAATPAPAPSAAIDATAVIADAKDATAPESKAEAKESIFAPSFHVSPDVAPIFNEVIRKNKYKLVTPRLFSSGILKCDFLYQIALVLNQVHPSLSFTELAITQVQNLLVQLAHKVIEEAFFLSKTKGSVVTTSREIQTSIRLNLPGELAKHAVSEGVKAVTKFTSSRY